VFHPKRRAHDAVAEVRHFTARTYEWVVEGDIKACFDEISHPALMGRVRRRLSDKRVLALVKAFLKAGILGEEGALWDNDTGTPRGGILSPLLADVALSVLDEHIVHQPVGPAATAYQRAKRRRHGLPTTGWFGTRMTGCSPCRALGRTLKPCARRSQRCCPR
jgi:RNA-directed DNA polymerase